MELKPARQQTEEHPLRYTLIAVLAVASLWCITPMVRYSPRHGPSYPSRVGLVVSWLVALLCLASFLWCPRRQWIQKCVTALGSLATMTLALSDTVASSP